MRIVVASADQSTRDAIELLIDAQGDLQSVGDAADIVDLLLRIRSEQPDVVLLDWDVLGRRIDKLHELLALFDQPPSIIALSVREADRQQALDSGVNGFALKRDPPSQLLEIIRRCGQKTQNQTTTKHDSVKP